VETSEGDAFERLSAILNELRRDRAQMAPAFLFVDPYGFKIPAGLLGDLMKAGRVELFINVMWRELDMLIQQRPAPGTPHALTLDEIFGSGSWRTEVIGDGMDERLDRAIPRAIQELAGHADLSTTQRYMHLSPAATEDAIRLLDGRQSGLEPLEKFGDILDTRPGCDERRTENPA
jgi:three-Cys-motif partner protein